ncbi:hypothetical protein AB5J49_34445 [Streptomyces sp. R28]|uniref:Uncharacterized protein n=1 Tax=Streptomyces sp. R28 TaxID=3238628 RepID=A0AB39Q6X1_9ACTN
MGALDERAGIREEFLEAARNRGMGGQGAGQIVTERVAVGPGEQAVHDGLLESLERVGRDLFAKSPGIAFMGEPDRHIACGVDRDEW